MAGEPNRRAAANAAVDLVLRNELDRAAEAAIGAVRERVREPSRADRHHLLVIARREIEVVESSAVPEAPASR